MSFIKKIESEIKKPLPGRSAQYEMAHLGRKWLDKQPEFEEMPEGVRRAGVLILFYPHEGDWRISLMRRPARNNDPHSRQVSFPGGGMEEQDGGDIVKTALREAYEEVGILQEKVSVIGSLTDLYIPVSNNHVVPVVGFSDERPDFKTDPNEVEYILEPPALLFTKEEVVKKVKMEIPGGVVLPGVPCFDVENNLIWGATAMILSELKSILKRVY